jgi:hypothetical protein
MLVMKSAGVVTWQTLRDPLVKRIVASGQRRDVAALVPGGCVSATRVPSSAVDHHEADAPAMQPRMVASTQVRAPLFGQRLQQTHVADTAAARPPGLSTRKDLYRQTCGLSGERLITQLLITTSTLASECGKMLNFTRRTFTVVRGRCAWCSQNQIRACIVRSNVWRHVDADDTTARN